MGVQFKLTPLIWPDIKTESAAKTARIPALAFSIFSTCLWAAMSVTTLLGHKSIYGNLVFLYLTFFAIVSVGLFKMRREASVAYLVVCAIAIVFAWGHALELMKTIAGVLVSLYAVRGTFAYFHLMKTHNKPVHSDAPKGGA